MCRNKVLLQILMTCFFTSFLCFGSTEPEFLQENLRFYATTTADLDGDGLYEIIGVGQINSQEEDNYSAYIVLLRSRGNELLKYADLAFNISYGEKELPTRIRSVKVFQSNFKNEWNVFVTGRAGDDESGVGFLHHSRIKNNGLVPVCEKIIKNTDVIATHGYPLSSGDIDGDGIEEIIYGGFQITEHGDKADVRIFKFINGNIQEVGRPFEKLSIPFRVNAMDAADLDRDSIVDIVIAGRTKKTEGDEFSALAWWSKGSISHYVFKDKNPSRLRTVKIINSDGGNKMQLITGGRVEFGNLWLSDLRLWSLKQNQLFLKDRFCWTLGNKMRLRTITGVKDQVDRIKIGGRAEWKAPSGKMQWMGFIWEFLLNEGGLKPTGTPVFFDQGPDTRIRHLHLTPNGEYIASGFITDYGKKDKGFIKRISQGTLSPSN